MLGHASKTVSSRYGPTTLTEREAALVASRMSSIEERIAEILLTAKLRADYGELKLDRNIPVERNV